MSYLERPPEKRAYSRFDVLGKSRSLGQIRRPLRRGWLRSRWRQTPSQTGPYVARSGGFGFCGQICFGEASDQRSSDTSSAKIAGPVLPGAPFAFGCGDCAQLRTLDTSTVWRREGPDRIEKFFIQSLLRLAIRAGRGGPAAPVRSGANSRSGGTQRRTRTYRSWKRTAMVPSIRASTRTQALRIPVRMSRRSI